MTPAEYAMLARGISALLAVSMDIVDALGKEKFQSVSLAELQEIKKRLDETPDLPT